MHKKIAIIGAGVSGLSAAWALRKIGAKLTVFEKSRGLSGRAASRSRNGVRFDHGANYFKTDSKAVFQLIIEELPTDELVRIEKDVWTFNGAGKLSPGDSAINAESKWNYRSGISTLGKLLAAAADAEIVNGIQISRLEGLPGDHWRLFDSGDDALGEFDAVVMTPPSPQASALLGASRLPEPLAAGILPALETAKFHRQFSFILAMDGEIERPGDFFALVNSDRQHDIAWLSFENDKPGRVPSGKTVIVVQMSPRWSREHFDAPLHELTAFAAANASELLGCPLAPEWTDSQRWRFAHPFSKSDRGALEAARPHRLYFAGDGLIGKGRVPRAIETGLEAAQKIREDLSV